MKTMSVLFLGYSIIALEALLMCWLQRDLWKTGITIAGMLLLLGLMVWIPVSAADAYEGASELATPGRGTVQASPTVDPTMAALQKEQLTLQVKQLQNQLQNQNSWLVNNSTALIAAVTTLTVALFGIYQWTGNRRDARRKEKEAQDKESKDRQAAQDKELADRKAERERREEEQNRWLEDRKAEREQQAEERFQKVVEGLGSVGMEAKVGAAITLRTFLRPGYEQFYMQTFDLAVAHLRLPRTPNPSDDPDNPLPPTTLSQALIVVFKEAFPLARDSHNSSKEEAVQSLDVTCFSLDLAGHPVYPTYVPEQSLDASSVILDHAYLVGADLERIYMREGTLRVVNLRNAKLGGAYLQWANLNGAYLRRADLRGAKLMGASLQGSQPWEADLRGVDCRGADFSGAYLRFTDLRGAGLLESKFRGADLKGAKLSGADLHRADFSEADLSETDIEDALLLSDTKLIGVKGLTKKQLEALKNERGAIIDEDLTTTS